MSLYKIGQIAVLSCVFLSACTIKQYQPAWQEPEQTATGQEAKPSFDEIRKNLEKTASPEDIRTAISALQRVVAGAPEHRTALALLGNLHILLGTAYSIDNKEKAAHFRLAMHFCEMAMYVNHHFRAVVLAGEKPWEAAGTLQADDAPAMLFWVTALQYEFKEVMTLAEKIVNVGWLRHTITFLDRITETAPDFGGGAVEFAYAISYSALPYVLGGDSRMGLAYLEKSLAKGQGYLLPTWGRGKYFHQVTGDFRTARQDLRWVSEQNFEDYKDFYPWRIHFITDAALQLKSL
jgi:hypothetical protein